ncbi:MAG: hypothetical protein G01um10147_1093 [Microgenomates group bacterium Gr01-1014_7]|nr:MAG: hypothetical protein G01um10147_1093 [Microgenomates group bacterium Gr01-1014_7]
MLKLMGNTVGSKDIFKTAEDFYILGLWLADGYWRSGSIGLTSVTPVSLYQYLAARTFVLYLKKDYRDRISQEIKKYSVKLAP